MVEDHMTRRLKRLTRSLLILAIRYTEQRRNGLFYYQRAVPLDLRDRLSVKIIKVPLGTDDPATALQKVKRLNAQHEKEWELLRSDPTSSPAAAKAQALELLRKYGLTPHAPSVDQDEAALDALFAPMEEARIAYAEGDEETYRNAPVAHYLSPVQCAALDLIKPRQDRLEDALEVYLSCHQKGDSEERRKKAGGAIAAFVAAVGDKPLQDIRRANVRAFIDHEAARGMKTGTIRRYLTELRAVFAKYVLEKELSLSSPFEKHTIRNEGEDTDEGRPLDGADWHRLAHLCRSVDDPPRWAIALQMGTGARIGEIVGLTLAEVILDAPIPYVVFTRNAHRGIKTDRAATNGRRKKDSFRGVPLVGVALWAARRIHEAATPGQLPAFPQYVGADGKVKNDSASATLNKWIKGQGFTHTTHDFRHTMRDLLRNTGCPSEVAKEIGGWAKEDVGDRVYGDGHTLSIRQKHLLAAVGNS
jgi:integrase